MNTQKKKNAEAELEKVNRLDTVEAAAVHGFISGMKVKLSVAADQEAEDKADKEPPKKAANQ